MLISYKTQPNKKTLKEPPIFYERLNIFTGLLGLTAEPYQAKLLQLFLSWKLQHCPLIPLFIWDLTPDRLELLFWWQWLCLSSDESD